MNVVDFTTDMVRVQFDNYHKQYTFRLPKDLIGKVYLGDTVVVQCKDKHLALATVCEVNASVPSGVELSWVICKIEPFMKCLRLKTQKLMLYLRSLNRYENRCIRS